VVEGNAFHIYRGQHIELEQLYGQLLKEVTPEKKRAWAKAARIEVPE
jgi:hypothetical protein